MIGTKIHGAIVLHGSIPNIVSLAPNYCNSGDKCIFFITGSHFWARAEDASVNLGDGIMVADVDEVRRLIEQLTHGSRSERKLAAKVLGDMRNPRTIDCLVDALVDGCATVRSAAAEALGKLGDPGVVKHLVGLLLDRNFYVRLRAAKALDQIGWKASNDEDEGAYLVAKWDWDGAVKVGTSAVLALLNVLRESTRDTDLMVIEALGRIRDRRAVELLIIALSDNDWSVRLAAAGALGKIGDRRSVSPLLRSSSRDKDSRVRECADRALIKMGAIIRV